jgi:hypothetical protein
MREEYKHPYCVLRRDEIIGQGRYVCQNTQLATGVSVIHRLVQKYETLAVLPKQLTETQEKSALFSRRGVLGRKFRTRKKYEVSGYSCCIMVN